MKMSYTVLGTNNMQAAVEFYNSLFEQTAPNQVLATERMTFWQFEDFAFAIAIPFDEEPATSGNGTMIGFDVGSSEGLLVIPAIVGSSAKAGKLANKLFDEGINVQPIFYPAVEERMARLRFFICSSHTKHQIELTIDKLTEALAVIQCNVLFYDGFQL